MRFSTLPVLEHLEVTLRPIEAADLEHWFACLTNPGVYEHTSWNPTALDELEHSVWAAQPHTPDSSLRLAIACRETNQLVGTVGFHTVSAAHRSAELAYDLAPTHWQRGIAGAAAQVMTQWAHEHAGVVRVQATVLESNIRSMRLLERCGFRREGLLRSYRQVRGRPGNFWMYGHLAGD